MIHTKIDSHDEKAARRLRLVALFALATVLLLGVTQYLYADPDMWHEMALWREFLRPRNA